jgi:hypothetical protein
MEKNDKAGKRERYFAVFRTAIRIAESYSQTTLLGVDLLNHLLTSLCRLACTAFEAVFQKRQTKFGDLLAWLEEVKKGKALRAQAAGLRGVVERYHR